jgi:hypothetical protein
MRRIFSNSLVSRWVHVVSTSVETRESRRIPFFGVSLWEVPLNGYPFTGEYRVAVNFYC